MPHIASLTSLRFFAAFVILIFHMGVWGTFGLPRNEVLAQGVSFFFVLSGFILTYTYSGYRDGWGRYYQARFARIWPVHAATFLVALVVFRANISSMPEGSQPWVAALNLGLVQSWIPVGYVAGSFNGVSWSISNEAFFYLLCPLMLHPRFGLLALAAIFVAGFAALAVADHYVVDLTGPAFLQYWSNFIYKGPFVRILEFCMGVLAAKLFLANRSLLANRLLATALEVAAIAVIVVASIHYFKIVALAAGHPAIIYWLRMTSGAVFFTLAIYIFAFNRGLISQALSHKVLIRLGEISFALYMTHQFVLAQTWRLPALVGAPAAVVATVILSIAVAYVLWLVVEVPARKLILSRAAQRSETVAMRRKSIALPEA